MDTVNSLFPEVKYTNTELHELAFQFNHPTVKKYLRQLAGNAVKEIAHAQRKPGEHAESFLERLAVARGGLAALETLLAIEKPAQAA